MRIRRRFLASVFAVSAAVGVPGLAKADIITYTLSGLSSGQIGASTFANAQVTLSLTGNTTAVVADGPGFYNIGGMTITIAGIGVAAVIDPVAIYAGESLDPLQGVIFATWQFSATFANATLIGSSVAPAGYDLRSDAGPFIVFPSHIGSLPAVVTHTTLGNLTFTQNFEAAASTFRAVVATPEPSSFVLLLTGVLIIVGARRRIWCNSSASNE